MRIFPANTALFCLAPALHAQESKPKTEGWNWEPSVVSVFYDRPNMGFALSPRKDDDYSIHYETRAN